MAARLLSLLLAAFFTASRALRTYREEPLVPALNTAPVEPAPLERGNETAAVPEPLRDTPFKNVLLVVHCRLLSKKRLRRRGEVSSPQARANIDPTSTICHEREWMVEPYRKFFPDVMWMTLKDCYSFPTNPHQCLAKLAKTRAVGRDGIFYMHFDALLKPNFLARTFDKGAIGTFSEQTHCKISNGTMENCGWHLWSQQMHGRYNRSLNLVASRAASVGVEYDHVWIGTDDLFYIPSSVFDSYAEIAPMFYKGEVHHEVAGPSMWRLLAKEKNVAIASLNCSGSCCSELNATEAASPELQCGHAFNLAKRATRQAVHDAILLERQ